MAKDNLLDYTKDLGVVIPPTEPEQLFTMIGKEKVAIVRNPEIKETPETLIHHHNDLDQPWIDITSGLAGTSITSPDNNDLLAYDTPSGLWINQTAVGAAVVPEGGTTTNLTLVQPTIGTMSATGGTATNLIAVTPTIGTMTATGGTATNLVLITPTIGTPALTGGTLNPIAYQAGGTVGVDGTAVYVKTIVAGTADTWGTITFTKGIATSVN